MKKYRIIVTPPKAKKMRGSGKVIISIANGWTEGKEKVHPVGDSPHFDFEMPDNVPWVYNNRIRDGNCFDIKLVYSNKDGTKEEILKPVPEELK